MTAWYNENDPFAAQWLRELIADGLIAPGIVDERSIEDVTPDDVRPFRQCHFFAGIGVWSLAARRAGIPDDAPLWTGSCPCQPFSAAGKRTRFADERHLWPAFHYLIEQCSPPLVVGEQVAGTDGDAWLDLVSADLDATGYAFGAAETCAAGFGAPHERSRNYWVAVLSGERLERIADPWAAGSWIEGVAAERDCDEQRQRLRHDPAHDGAVSGLADSGCPGRELREQFQQSGAVTEGKCRHDDARRRPSRIDRPGPLNGLWRDADWLRCRDEKWRPVAPGSFPLADAGTVRNRVGLLRGAGNACTLGQAEGFLRAVVAAVRA